MGVLYRLIKEYISIGIKPFGETKSKAMRACTQSGQHHTIIEVCDSNIVLIVLFNNSAINTFIAVSPVHLFCPYG